MMNVAPDFKKHTPVVDESAVSAIGKNCGIAMRSADASLVSATDPGNWPPCAAALRPRSPGSRMTPPMPASRRWPEKTKGAPQKNSVTFYYQFAKATGTLDKRH
jgi:hypothetical protein